jgi:hypothetical protein
MPSALAQRLLSEASELDPFEFVGSFASDSVAGRDADDSRSRWIRFRQSALTSSFLSFVV